MPRIVNVDEMLLWARRHGYPIPNSVLWLLCHYPEVKDSYHDGEATKMVGGSLISREEAVYIASGYCHPANVVKELQACSSAIPLPHGRLIDADALISELTIDPVECPGCPEPEYLEEFIDLLEGAPTVVEAEG